MAWQIDSAHSDIQFSVRHMMISNVRGHFGSFSGTIEGDASNPSAASAYVEIDVASIDTKNEQRDGHLQSPDFFDVANHPKITFKSTKLELTSENEGKLHGDLTIKGITKPVVLDVEYAGMSKSPFGTTNAGFSATAKINRKDWDLGWNVALETGGWLVGDEIKINIDLELIQQA